MRAAGFLFLGLGLCRRQTRGAGLGKGIISALIERQLAVFEMQDRADRAVEQATVVADHQNGMRIARQIAFQPKRAFEVKVIRRLVQKQQIGLRKQHGGKRHAHAPAAGKGAAWH